MEPSGADGTWIGRRIGQLRRAHDWTLAALAARVELSATQLSRIESGARHSSVGTLIELARAFGITLSELVAEEHRSPFQIVRARDRITRETANGRLAPLSGDYPGLQAVHLSIPASSESPTAQHRGEEWLYVLSCAVEVSMGTSIVTLESGDAMHFQASVPHSIRNVGSTPAEVLLVSAPAGNE